MYRLLKCASFLLFLFPASLSLNLIAVPTAQAETITKFSVSANLAQDQELTLTEHLTYDFGESERHGIFRFIPVRYSRNGANYNLRLKVLDVKRDGKAESYTTSNANGQLEVKIGDANKTLTGIHEYTIEYQTNRALNSFPDHDELYWNVTGNEWEVPIEQSNFSLALPAAIERATASSTCFTGAYGSNESACTTTLTTTSMNAVTTRVLQEYEGFTIVFGFPKGIVKPWSTLDLIWHFIQDNGAAFFPLIALFFMLFWWWTRGRDPKLGTIIPEYEPPADYTPALVATVKQEGNGDSHAVTATLIDLARRGFLKIRFDEERHLFGNTQTYTFVKQECNAELTPYEKTLYEGLFSFSSDGEVALSDLKGTTFYRSVLSFRKKLQDDMDAKKLFDGNPQVTRGAYIVVGFLVGFGLIYLLDGTIFGAICSVLTGLIIAGFGVLMPRRTIEGNKRLAQIKGFEWFLSVTEKERLDFHNAPERTPDQFMSLLPFAIALGIEKKWAAQFASLTIPPPSWAEGTGLHNFNAIWLASNLSDLHSAAQSSAYAAPSSAGSGGSGFSGGGSGGGFGGGGGGSW